ncbi:DUF362 domain-containing protein [Bacteroidota bacterium]
MKNFVIKKIINRFRFNFVKAKIIFFASGIAATIWFLIRVIPKPSRASYPCVRAAAPVMSSFILYLLSLPAAIFVFKRAGKSLVKSKYALFAIFALLGISIFLSSVLLNKYTSPAKAAILESQDFVANDPIGIPSGLYLGRVVWVHNPDATNEDLVNEPGDYWYEDNNADQDIIDTMLANGIKKLTEADRIADSWNNVFEYFNFKHGKGKVGYSPGEKFFIKINLTNSCCAVPHRMDATPQLVLSLLKQLVEDVGVAEDDISLGDPFRTFRDNYYDKCHSVYPDINYYDGNGDNGRIQTTPTSTHVLQFSDGDETASLPQAYIDADYFINMSCLKTHDAGGITLGAKNHQGSILHPNDDPSDQSAFYMHYALPAEDRGHGKYRHLVDYLGHKDMGGKTLISIVDGIWAGENWEGNIYKWEMEPFNGDYPSSIFLSQDLLAIESVCFDFLLTEHESGTASRYPYIDGTDDYLLQAADPSNWPSNITYDPEGDGTSIGSLGIHEHWNNSTDKQYKTNLEGVGGIHLVSIPESLVASVDLDPSGIFDYTAVSIYEEMVNNLDIKSYPSPAVYQANFEFNLDHKSTVLIEMYNLDGQKVQTLLNGVLPGGSHKISWDVNDVPSGMYIASIIVENSYTRKVNSIKIQVK